MPREKSRIKVTDEAIQNSINDIVAKLQFRMKQKGRHSYISTHESLGKITEEFWEYVEAVKGNDDDEVQHELIDIAVGCIFALASMKQYETGQESIPSSERID